MKLVDFNVTFSCMSRWPQDFLRVRSCLCWVWGGGRISFFFCSASNQITRKLLRISNKVPIVTLLFLKLFLSTV